MAAVQHTLTEPTIKIERILFFLHLLHIEGASDIFYKLAALTDLV